jgi:hypothetical protein
MSKKVLASGLFVIAALGFNPIPVKADTAVIQSTTQDTYINGEYNSATQTSEQININRSRGRNRGSTGIVQDVYQGSTVVGEGNDAYQRNSQINVTQTQPLRRRDYRGPVYRP